MAGVVLAAGAVARKGDRVGAAVLGEVVVDELATV
jgi:hypothetical protein